LNLNLKDTVSWQNKLLFLHTKNLPYLNARAKTQCLLNLGTFKCHTVTELV